MTRFPFSNVEIVDRLREYFLSRERKWLVGFRRRRRSRMIRAARAATRSWPHVDTESVSAADFSDPESQRVLAAAARSVAAELGRQAARELFAKVAGTEKDH